MVRNPTSPALFRCSMKNQGEQLITECIRYERYNTEIIMTLLDGFARNNIKQTIIIAAQIKD